MADQGQAEFAFEKYREYLAAVDQSWSRLTAALSRLLPSEVESPGTCGEWSVRDLIAHVAVWDQVAIEKVHTISTNALPPEDDESLDEFNKRTTDESRAFDLGELQQRMTATHESLVAAFEQAAAQPAEILERIEWATVDDTWKHYDDHLAQIQARFPPP